ncbi:hypothetical protein ACIHEJ_26815 [Streptomyces sp. NPDC052301]|uniref:hypothetical protein n=1 Tax=Streptomyces sp. NPDC052301 TaxID=3365687 RepID=UPI0037D7F4C2
MSGGSGSGMRRGIDALKDFKGKLDKVLHEFDDGDGGPSKIAQQQLSRSSFGGTNAKFDEAGDLHTAYETVHARLIHLSQTLGLHIEALQLASHAADATYDLSEDEVRRRFYQIRAKIDAQYQEDMKKAAAADKAKASHEHTKPAAPHPGRSHGTSMGTDLS